jgi:hypothetical protein
MRGKPKNSSTLFNHPLFPKTITKERTTNTEGKTKGTKEIAFNKFLPGKSLLAIIKDTGNPIIKETKVETKAWEKEFQSKSTGKMLKALVNASIEKIFEKTMAMG